MNFRESFQLWIDMDMTKGRYIFTLIFLTTQNSQNSRGYRELSTSYSGGGSWNIFHPIDLQKFIFQKPWDQVGQESIVTT